MKGFVRLYREEFRLTDQQALYECKAMPIYVYWRFELTRFGLGELKV